MKPTTSQTHARFSLVAFGALLVFAASFAASNMGFKVIKPVFYDVTGPIGDMWTSIPFYSYANGEVLCTKLGLTSTGITRASITILDPITGQYDTANCGSTGPGGAASIILVPGLGVLIRQPNTSGAPTNLILAGAHDNTLQVTIPDAGAGEIGSVWYSVPYHTTAVTTNDLCTQIGLTSTGITRATLQRVNLTDGAYQNATCGSTTTDWNLEIGEAIRIREPNGPITFTPLHY